MRACFWIDAGAAVGGGHVIRAESLAQALEARGFESILCADDLDAVRRAGSGQLPVHALERGRFDRACEALKPALAVIDLPHTRPACPTVLQQLPASGARRLCFDASNPGYRDAELFVDAVACPTDLAGLPPGARALLGPRHAVLRPTLAGLRQARNADPDGRSRTGRTRVLIGFGASDPTGLTPRALRALAPLASELAVEVLVGPLVGPGPDAEIQRAARALPEIHVHRSVSDPSPLLAAADLAVLPFGNLFLEAATAGVGCLLWHPSLAHALVARRFAAHFEGPAAIDLGAAAAGDEARVRDALYALLRDPPARRALAARAAARLDGRGAQRVAEAALSLVSLGSRAA